MDYAADGEWNIINISSRPVHNNPPHLCVKKHYFTKTDNYHRQPNRESAVAAGISVTGKQATSRRSRSFSSANAAAARKRKSSTGNHQRQRRDRPRLCRFSTNKQYDYEQHHGLLAQRMGCRGRHERGDGDGFF